jgi:hypothetical protein
MGRLLYVVFDHQSSLMMEAVRTSETSVDNYFTRQYIPEDNSEQIHCKIVTTEHFSIRHGHMTSLTSLPGDRHSAI